MNGQPKRDMTVGELIDLLSEYPRYHSVIPVVGGVRGVMLATRQETTGDDGVAVLVGEVDLPITLQEQFIHGSHRG